VLAEINNSLLLEGKTPILAENKIFGLEDVPAKSDSFLAAASFQDTKIVLTNASAKNQIDALRGLKENVMLGRLIPVGTGKQDQLTILENGRKMYKKEY
jgi:DNA-directed RNA polymerase subunit beta'